jgi:aspartate carbamoyltransferase regulatory subunit
MNERHLLIPKIENGIVIDHIPVGFGIKLLEILHAHPQTNQGVISVGLNYSSTRMGTKDIIKLCADDLPARLLQNFALICPGISIKRIRNFVVDKKFVLEPTTELEGVICRNPNCITNNAKHVRTLFTRVNNDSRDFRCHFCEKVFAVTQLSMTPLDPE